VGACDGVWSVGEDETPSASETITGVLVILVGVVDGDNDVDNAVDVDKGFERELGLVLERRRMMGTLEDRGRRTSQCEMLWLLSSPSAKVIGG
jgi:hypothetical protein